MNTESGAAPGGLNVDRAHRGRSALSPNQKRLLRTVLLATVFMTASGILLSSVRLLDLVPALAVPPRSLPAFLQVVILLHIGLGWLVLAPAFGFALWHLGKVWRRKNRKAFWTGILVLASALALGISGPFIQTQASSRDHRGMFWLHVAAAVAMAGAYALHRLFSSWRPTARTAGRSALGLAGLSVLLIAGHVLIRPAGPVPAPATPPDRPAPAAAAASTLPERTAASLPDPYTPFRAAADVSADRVFFPAAATTTSLGFLSAQVLTGGDLPDPRILKKDMEAHGYLVHDTVGSASCARCHADIVEQWSRSAHRFSSFNNPFYRKAIETLREREGFLRSKWCSSCHDPVLMLPGAMDRPIDPASAEAQAGLTCLACHQIDRLHSRTGNGAYNIPDTEPEPYLFAGSSDSLGQILHDTLVKARPDVHKEQMLKPFFRSGEYCSVCHKVSLDVPVNGYRWFRGQNEFDNWEDSGVNHAAARTFYLPPEKKTCQDCHMPFEPTTVLGDVSARNGKVKSHRFLAVNTALPHIRGDADTICRTEEFLRDGKLTVDIFSLHRKAPAGPAPGDASAAGEGAGIQAIAPVDRSLPALEAGESVEVHVVVRNKGVGHTFPGGTNDSNEGWIEFQVASEDGREILHSGRIEADGSLESKAHRYHAIIVDPESNPVHTRVPTTFRAMVYARVLPPSTSDVARFRFTVPPDLAGKGLWIRADLKWRKFDQDFLKFVYQGKEIPKLPITTIATSKVELAVTAPVALSPPAAAPAATLAASPSATPAGAVPGKALPEDWMRFNDYGVALLLQGDTRAAVQAFRRVAELVPARADGARNLARAALIDGSIDAAVEHLKACERIKPGDPQTALFWGMALERRGSYELADKAYSRVLDFFPKDRQALFQRSRALYLAGRFRDALTGFLKVLEIDPEHREAHYHRMLCYRGLGEEAAAAEAEKAYLKYQIDESAQEFTRNFRLKHPESNFEAQRIHVHE